MENQKHYKQILDLYNYVESDLLVEKSYINFGYWKNCRTLKCASKKLIDLVIETSKLVEANNVLDVGFGFGVQDLYFFLQCPHLKITGINIVPSQVTYAKSIVEKEGLTGSINILLKDANSILDFGIESFERIISIEAAFHFNTRRDFLQKSFEVLKKDGVLCVADILQDYRLIKDNQNLQDTLRKIAIPKENIVSIQEYENILTEIGFKNIKILDVSASVIPYAAMLLKKENKMLLEESIELPENFSNKYIEDFKINTLIHRYCIIYAEKS